MLQFVVVAVWSGGGKVVDSLRNSFVLFCVIVFFQPTSCDHELASFVYVYMM